MTGRGVGAVLEGFATLVCHCIRVLCIGHLPFADDVFNVTGHSKRYRTLLQKVTFCY